mgnify:CR=1 FL=1
MKIILVQVSPDKEFLTIGLVPPLGLGYIASTLEEDGHRVSIIDGVGHNYSIEEINKLIIKERFLLNILSIESAGSFTKLILIQPVIGLDVP